MLIERKCTFVDTDGDEITFEWHKDSGLIRTYTHAAHGEVTLNRDEVRMLIQFLQTVIGDCISQNGDFDSPTLC